MYGPNTPIFDQPGALDELLWGQEIPTTPYYYDPGLFTQSYDPAAVLPESFGTSGTSADIFGTPGFDAGPVYGGGAAGDIAKGAYRVGKKVVTKAIPVVGAVSTAKDLYDFGNWVWDRANRPPGPGYEGPIVDTYHPEDYAGPGPY
jgi:hypothetical protein